MSDHNTTVMKSCSEGELLNSSTENNTVSENLNISSGDNVHHLPQSRLKRTFTLPRNPLRMSKRKNKPAKESVITVNCVKDNTQNNLQNNDSSEKDNKKVFRRPSWKKFINKLAQRMNYDRKNVSYPDNRVPPINVHQWGPGQTPGVSGLRNHGNTCFMNAVLQCLAHTDVLAEYFVLDQYKVDLSRRNKLTARKFGTRGELTEALALVLKALWACRCSPELSSAFRTAVERHGAQYRGSQQHDAQEFLLWLLDKVHEDLNTASKKKYKAIKTLGRPDEVVAAETLANHVRCNSSFVQAVFQAQFRSSLVCPRCLKQSNTFDPFHCISVQLPQLSRHNIFVTVLYTQQQPRQVQLGVSVPAGVTIGEVRAQLASDTSIERERMLLIEIGDSGFGRTLTDAQPAAAVAERDPIYCIEAPVLRDATDDATTSAYILLCWINVEVKRDDSMKRFGSPYTMQVSRETSYSDLQKLILKEMASILHDDILTSAQPSGVFLMRLCEPALGESEILDSGLPHPLFMEAVDQALALCSNDGGPPHIKLILEWTTEFKESIIADDTDQLEEHYSVTQLKSGDGSSGSSAPLTLTDCLRHYTRAETLAAEDAWRCPHCQQYLPVVKTLGLWSLPDILVIHLKRFRQQTVKGRHSSKLTTMVDFPLYGFDMTPHLANKNAINTAKNLTNGHIDTSNPVILGGLGWSPWKRPRKQSQNNDNTYDLYGICYHHGDDLETGHYTAACKNPYDNNWYSYDDTKVTNISQNSDDITAELVNNSAYILFYQKRNGVYVGSSSSSAASTSSVGSIGDHWVSRMPKFNYVPPKSEKKITEPASKTANTIETKSQSTESLPHNNSNLIESNSITNSTIEIVTSLSISNNDNSINSQTLSSKSSVAKNKSESESTGVDPPKTSLTSLENFPSALKNSTTELNKKTVENKSTNTIPMIDMVTNRQSLFSSHTVTKDETIQRKSLDSKISYFNATSTATETDGKMLDSSATSKTNNRETSNSKPLYTTSIYINSFGNADITTNCIRNSSAVGKVPVSENTVMVTLNNQRDSFYRGDRGYATLGPLGRKTSIDKDVDSEKLYHSDDEAPPARNESWMSPTPVRKLSSNHSVTSM